MSKPATKPTEMALLSECAEFLDGIGLVSPAFDLQVKALLERVRENFPVIKAYMSHSADQREINEDAEDFATWFQAKLNRLEELRTELKAERISYGELFELQDMIPFIGTGDVELLEAAGVPEFPDSE